MGCKLFKLSCHSKSACFLASNSSA